LGFSQAPLLATRHAGRSPDFKLIQMRKEGNAGNSQLDTGRKMLDAGLFLVCLVYFVVNSLSCVPDFLIDFNVTEIRKF
jgi:hypothetical protein